MATRTAQYYAVSGSTGNAQGTYKILPYVPRGGWGIRFVYGNFRQSGNTDGPVNADSSSGLTTSITVNATVDFGGKRYILKFAGKSTVTIDPECIAVSDPLGIDVPDGTTLTEYCHPVLGASTSYWPGFFLTNTAAGDGFTAGSDLTGSGTPASVTVSAYGACAIVGHIRSQNLPTVALIVDSNGTDTGDYINGGAMLRAMGMTDLQNLVLDRGYVHDGRQGASWQDWASPQKSYIRWTLIDTCDIAACILGSNDINGGTTLDGGAGAVDRKAAR